MLPAAPALFSTTTGCFQTLPSASAIMRGRMSAVPPAGLGTMILTGKAGKASPACEASPVDSKPKVAASITSRRAGVTCIRQFPSALALRIGAGRRLSLRPSRRAQHRPVPAPTPYPQARLTRKSSEHTSANSPLGPSELDLDPAVDRQGCRRCDRAWVLKYRSIASDADRIARDVAQGVGVEVGAEGRVVLVEQVLRQAVDLDVVGHLVAGSQVDHGIARQRSIIVALVAAEELVRHGDD